MNQIPLIRTNMSPYFLNVAIALDYQERVEEDTTKLYKAIIDSYGKPVEIPFLGIDKSDRASIPTPLGGVQVVGFMGTPNDIAETIEKYIIGNETLVREHTTPITGIIDFNKQKISRLEDAFDILRPKYGLKEIELYDF